MANLVNAMKNIWSGGTQSQSITSTSTGTGTILNGGAGQTTIGISGVYPIPPTLQNAISTKAHYNLNILENYMELCGDKLEVIRLSKTIETKDPKVSMLKLLKEGEFLKNVGLKYDENTYYVIREQE